MRPVNWQAQMIASPGIEHVIIPIKTVCRLDRTLSFIFGNCSCDKLSFRFPLKKLHSHLMHDYDNFTFAKSEAEQYGTWFIALGFI